MMNILSFFLYCLIFLGNFIFLLYYFCIESRLNNIVIVFCKGYSRDSIEMFLKTLKRVSSNSSLLLFSDNETIAYTKNRFKKGIVSGIEFLNSYPYYQSTNQKYPISTDELKRFIPNYINSRDNYFYNTIRFFLINMWINKYGYLYKSILTCDIRDIMFQKDPFTFYKEKGVYLQQEVYIRNNRGGILADDYNLRWIKPYNVSNDILAKPIINSGQIIGTYSEMKEFISEFCSFMNNTRKITAEQGSLNFFVYSRKFKYNLFLKEHGYGYALLLHYPIPFTKDNFTPENNYLYNFDNTIPPIVHSYLHGLWLGSEKRKQKYKNFIDFHK